MQPYLAGPILTRTVGESSRNDGLGDRFAHTGAPSTTGSRRHGMSRGQRGPLRTSGDSPSCKFIRSHCRGFRDTHAPSRTRTCHIRRAPATRKRCRIATWQSRRRSCRHSARRDILAAKGSRCPKELDGRRVTQQFRVQPAFTTTYSAPWRFDESLRRRCITDRRADRSVDFLGAICWSSVGGTREKISTAVKLAANGTPTTRRPAWRNARFNAHQPGFRLYRITL